jgi:hypothetical protein
MRSYLARPLEENVIREPVTQLTINGLQPDELRQDDNIFAILFGAWRSRKWSGGSSTTAAQFDKTLCHLDRGPAPAVPSLKFIQQHQFVNRLKAYWP